MYFSNFERKNYKDLTFHIAHIALGALTRGNTVKERFGFHNLSCYLKCRQDTIPFFNV